MARPIPPLFVTLTLSTALFHASLARAGKLDEVRERTDHGSDDSSSDSGDSDSDSECSWLELLLLSCGDSPEGPELVDGTADVGPRGPNQLLASTHFFLPYPYAFGNPGNTTNVQLPPTLEVSPCGVNDPRCWSEHNVVACVDETCFSDPYYDPTAIAPRRRKLRSGRLQLFADVGEDTDGLTRGTLGGVADSNGLFSLDTRWTYWRENLTSDATDSLWLGDVNLKLQALSLPAIQLAVGAGPRLLADGADTTAGANLTASVELYPISPLVLRAEFDTGNLGPALSWEAQTHVGVIIQRLELYVGASRLDVGGVRFDSAFAGLRVHL
jgi:hypothetical protein